MDTPGIRGSVQSRITLVSFSFSASGLSSSTPGRAVGMPPSLFDTNEEVSAGGVSKRCYIGKKLPLVPVAKLQVDFIVKRFAFRNFVVEEAPGNQLQSAGQKACWLGTRQSPLLRINSESLQYDIIWHICQFLRFQIFNIIIFDKSHLCACRKLLKSP